MLSRYRGKTLCPDCKGTGEIPNRDYDEELAKEEHKDFTKYIY